MQKFARFVELTFALAAAMLVFAAGIIALKIITVDMHLNPSDLPSWVQAIGSVGAIGAAIWISNDQYRRQRKERLHNSTFEASICCDEALKAVNRAIESIAGISADSPLNSHLPFIGILRDEFEELLADMRRVTLSDMQRSDAIEFAKAQTVIRKYSHGFSAVMIPPHNYTFDFVVRALNQSKASIEPIAQEIGQNLQRLNLQQVFLE